MLTAASFDKLLDSCLEMELSHLRPLMDRMFENADVALLDFAEKAESNMAQSVFFEAMSEVRKKRKLIEDDFYAQITLSFTDFPVKPASQNEEADAAPGIAGLSLVDTESMEISVATQNATRKLSGRILDRIFALKQRLSIVNDGHAIEPNEIPGGPVWLGAAFQHAIQQLELENKVRLVFIALFDKYLLGKADTVFDEYNERLIQADILPNLRYEIRKQADGVEVVQQTSAAAQPPTASPAAADHESEEQTPSELGDDIFGRICQLMVGRRTSSGQGEPPERGNVTPIRGGGHTGGGHGNSHGGGGSNYGGGSGAAGGNVLVSQLSSLQSQIQSSMSGSEFIETLEIDTGLIDRLQHTLKQEREKIFGDVDRRKVPSADTDVIELVGMLFEYMLKEDQLPNVVKALLSRLHTPLLKVAVLDRRFFTRTRHPARKLLNDMTAAGIRWVEETQIDRGIFPKMKEIVDEVLLDFHEDVDIFDTFVQKFDKSVEELRRRTELVEKRTTEAANGQERLLAARNRAQQACNDLSRGKNVSEETMHFLQRVWADKLTFILLRSEKGDKSAEWKDAVALAKRIVQASCPPGSEQEREERKQSLDVLQAEIREATSTSQQADKEKLLLKMYQAQSDLLNKEIIAAEPETATVEEDDVAPDTPVDEPDRNTVALSPEQEAMISKLKVVPFGTWFEFHKEGAPVKRAKLSWRSTVTGKFMFVDQLGVKAAIISTQELASYMIDGKVTMATAEKKPFVDRALSAIHRMLDHGNKESVGA